MAFVLRVNVRRRVSWREGFYALMALFAASVIWQNLPRGIIGKSAQNPRVADTAHSTDCRVSFDMQLGKETRSLRLLSALAFLAFAHWQNARLKFVLGKTRRCRCCPRVGRDSAAFVACKLRPVFAFCRILLLVILCVVLLCVFCVRCFEWCVACNGLSLAA